MKKPRLSGSLDYMSGGSGGNRRKSASGSLTLSGGLGSITPGISYSKDTSRRQYEDGVVVDEFGRRIGISINGELFLDEGGENKLRAGASKDTMTGGYEATSGEGDAYKQALERYFLGLDLGPLSLDVNKAGDDVSGRAAYRSGKNMEFSVEDSNRGDPTFGFQFAKQFNEGGPVAAEEESAMAEGIVQEYARRLLLDRDDAGYTILSPERDPRPRILSLGHVVEKGLAGDLPGTRLELLAGEMLALAQRAAEGKASPEELELLETYQEFMASRMGM